MGRVNTAMDLGIGEAVDGLPRISRPLVFRDQSGPVTRNAENHD